MPCFIGHNANNDHHVHPIEDHVENLIDKVRFMQCASKHAITVSHSLSQLSLNSPLLLCISLSVFLLQAKLIKGMNHYFRPTNTLIYKYEFICLIPYIYIHTSTMYISHDFPKTVDKYWSHPLSTHTLCWHTCQTPNRNQRTQAYALTLAVMCRMCTLEHYTKKRHWASVFYYIYKDV